MKLFKLEIHRGRRGRELLAHFATEKLAVERVRGKFPGWEIRNVVEIDHEAHFQIADLVEEPPDRLMP
jgi:hypothetical protein